MNAGRAIRHLEEAGFDHRQATGLVEVIQDDVLAQIATKDFVELACERVKHDLRSEIHDLRTELKGDIHDLRDELKGDIHELRAELKGDIHDLRSELKADINGLAIDFRDRHISLVKWVCGIAIVQTASIIFGTVGLIEILK